MANTPDQNYDPITAAWNKSAQLRDQLASNAGKPDNLETGVGDALLGFTGSTLTNTGSTIKNLSLGDASRAMRATADGSYMQGNVDSAVDMVTGGDIQKTREQGKGLLTDALGLGDVQFVGVDPSKNPVKEAVGNVIGKAASAGTAVADSIDQNIVKPVVEPVGKAIQSGGEGLKNLRSDDAKLADQSKFYTQDEDGNYHFGDAWSDPAKFVTRAVDVFGSLAPTILSGLITKGAVAPMVTKSMLKRGLSAEAAAVIGKATADRVAQNVVLAGGIGMSVGQSKDQAREAVSGLSYEELMSSPTFRENVRLVNEDPNNQTLSSTQRLEFARERTAEQAASYAGSDPTTYAGAVAGTVLGDAYLFKMITGKKEAAQVTGNILARTAKGFFKGGVGEGTGEAIEEGLQKNIANRASNEVGGTNIDPWEGAGLAALEAGTLGVLSGGAVGSVSADIHGSSKPAADTTTNTATPPTGPQTTTPSNVAGEVDVNTAIKEVSEGRKVAGSFSIGKGPEGYRAAYINQGGELRVTQPFATAEEAQQAAIQTTQPLRAEAPQQAAAQPTPDQAMQQTDDLANIPAFMRNGQELSPELEQATNQALNNAWSAKTAQQAAEQNVVLQPREQTVTGNPDEPAYTRTGSELSGVLADPTKSIGGNKPRSVSGELIPSEQSQTLPATTQSQPPLTLDGQSNEVIPESRGLGYNNTINMPGEQGNGINDNYVPPVTLDRVTPDASLDVESIRDPRSPVAQAIDNAGSQADAIFGQLQSLRVTKRGKPFGSVKEAQLASRKTETPIALPSGGYGVVDKAELEQVQSNAIQQQSAPEQQDQASAQASSDGNKTSISDAQSSNDQANALPVDVSESATNNVVTQNQPDINDNTTEIGQASINQIADQQNQQATESVSPVDSEGNEAAAVQQQDIQLPPIAPVRFETVDKPDGTMLIKGDPVELKAWATNNKIKAVHNKSGIVIGKTSVQAAKDLIQSYRNDAATVGNDSTVVATQESAAPIADKAAVMQSPETVTPPEVAMDSQPTAAPETDISDDGQQALSPEQNKSFHGERSEWGDFPDVILHGKLADASAHPDYSSAKGGDYQAALRLVRDVLSKSAIEKMKEVVGDKKSIALAVNADEAVSRNAIPGAMADVIGKLLGVDVDLDIVQSRKVGRTARDGFGRLAIQPSFDGDVRTDRPYIIMDDTLTQGGTLANLKGFIENRGGKVIAATALTGKNYSSKLSINEQTLNRLRSLYGPSDLEKWWEDNFGYGFDKLTESEARYLINAKDPEKIRARVTEELAKETAPLQYEDAGDNGSISPNVITKKTDKETADKGGFSLSEQHKSEQPENHQVNKITDFGEKIGGAKKDAWQLLKDGMSGETTEEIKSLPLSKAWPEPNYQKLIDNKMNQFAVAFIRAARESIPTKPKLPSKVSTWSNQVKVLRDMSISLADGTIDPDSLKEKMLVSGGRMRYLNDILGKTELYQAVGHGKSLADLTLTSGHYSVFNGEKYSPSKVIWSVNRKSKSTVFGNWPHMVTHADTKEQVISQFKAMYDSLPENSEATKRTATFDIFSKRDGSGFYIGKKIGRHPTLLEGPFDEIKDARKYKDEHIDELTAKLEKVKEIPRERRDINNPRVGDDMRGGRDVTPEMFTEAFGFRGVEFGNWVENDRRQRNLNDAYDALMDMAAVIGIPPKAVSLNGELGIAFGARGSGGKNPYAAHYESGHVVINLTKKNGAGSLGHEWWHALDDYFARMRKSDEFMTESRMVNLSANGSNYFHSGDVRKEMVDAFGEVIRGIKNTALKARSSKLDAKRAKEYWTTNTEMSARAFESYLISKLQDQNASNDYLSNIVAPETWEAAEKLGFELDSSYPYPTAGEMPTIRASFDHFFSVIDHRKTDDGRVALFSKQSLERTPGEISGKHMTKPEAELAAKSWLKPFSKDISVKVAKDNSEFMSMLKEHGYGEMKADEIGNAAYIPDSKTLLLNSSQIENAKRLRQLMRHEILVHHGLRYVVGQEAYAKVINAIMTGYQNSPAIQQAMSKVMRSYGGADLFTQMEEVFAHYAENRPVDKGPIGRLWDRVVGMVRSALVKVGFLNQNEAEQQLDSILKSIAENMRQGAELSTDPVSGESTVMFSKSSTDSADSSQFGKAENIMKMGGERLINWVKEQRGLGLGTLTDRQIDQVYKDVTGGAVSRYQKLRTKMEADRNDILLDAETRIDPLWDAMPKDQKAALSNLMHDATMSRLHPDIPLEDNTWYQEAKDRLDKARNPETKAQYQQELDVIKDNYKFLSERYRLTSKQGKELYQVMKDTYSKQWSDLREAIEQRIDDVIGEDGKAISAELRLKMEQSLKHGPYFPLARFGDYVVRAKKGDQFIREHFEKRRDAERAMRQYQSDGYKSTLTVKEEKSGGAATAHDLGMKVMELLDKAKNENTDASQLKDSVWQAMLETLPDASYAKHAIHRKRTKGASRDGHRAFLNSVYHYAFHVSKIRYGHKMKSELDGMNENLQAALQGEKSNIKEGDLEVAQQVLNEMHKRHELNMNPKGSSLAGTLGNVGFLFYLGASPASAVINLTQNPMVMLPQLAGKFGYARAAKFMLKAMSDYIRHGVFKSGTKEAWVSLTRATKGVSADEKGMLNELYRAGVLDLTQAHSIAARADTDQQDVKQSSALVRTGMRWAGALFHNAEVLNREVAALAAYRLLKDQNPNMAMSQMLDQVTEMVYDGHGDYAASNRPRYMRGDVAKVLTQFKIYSQMMTFTLTRNAILSAKSGMPILKKIAGHELTHDESIAFRDGLISLKTLGAMLGSTFVMAGMMGLPTPISLILYGIAAAADDDDDRTAEASFRLGLTEALGPELGELIAKGPMNSMTGLSIADRTGLGDLWWRAPKDGTEGDDLIFHYLQQVAGPVLGIGVSAARGLRSFADGDIQRGVEAVSPKAIKDIAKAYRQASEGERTRSGDSIIDDVDAYHVAMQAMGFSAAKMSQVYAAREYIKGKEKVIEDERSNLLADFFAAKRSGDDEELKKVMDKIREFNLKHNRAEAITGKSINQSMKSRMRSMQRTQAGTYLSKNREYLRSEGAFLEDDEDDE